MDKRDQDGSRELSLCVCGRVRTCVRALIYYSGNERSIIVCLSRETSGANAIYPRPIFREIE